MYDFESKAQTHKKSESKEEEEENQHLEEERLLEDRVHEYLCVRSELCCVSEGAFKAHT